MVVIVDPTNQAATDFCAKFGFAPLEGETGHMFVPFKTIKDICGVSMHSRTDNTTPIESLTVTIPGGLAEFKRSLTMERPGAGREHAGGEAWGGACDEEVTQHRPHQCRRDDIAG